MREQIVHGLTIFTTTTIKNTINRASTVLRPGEEKSFLKIPNIHGSTQISEERLFQVESAARGKTFPGSWEIALFNQQDPKHTNLIYMNWISKKKGGGWGRLLGWFKLNHDYFNSQFFKFYFIFWNSISN